MGVKQVAALAIVGGLLFVSGVAVAKTTAQEAPTGTPANIQKESQKYPLLAKQLFVETPDDSLINFAPLRKELKQYFGDNKLDGSIYFEYLPTGTSIRIDGEERQVAASLLKVPAAMDLYKAAENNKINLEQKITLRQEWLDDGYGELYKKGAGYELTLREAAKIMLVESDNTALKAIGVTMQEAKAVGPGTNVFESLDADISQNPDLSVSIGARSYGSVLKCLYFSCYLNYKDSQELLDYLSETKFDSRLRAGVDDKSLKVAHKIGVGKEETQSDCGIVYLPNRHYLFCVMIKGDTSAATDKHIADMSGKVYDYLKSK